LKWYFRELRRANFRLKRRSDKQILGLLAAGPRYVSAGTARDVREFVKDSYWGAKRPVPKALKYLVGRKNPKLSADQAKRAVVSAIDDLKDPALTRHGWALLSRIWRSLVPEGWEDSGDMVRFGIDPDLEISRTLRPMRHLNVDGTRILIVHSDPNTEERFTLIRGRGIDLLASN